jgi:hypothetical protein
MSRDTVYDDPVLRNVLEYVEGVKNKLSRKNRLVNLRSMSLDTRVRDYNRFLHSTLFNADGTVNQQWFRENFCQFRNQPSAEYVLDKSYSLPFSTLSGRVVHGLFNYIANRFRKEKLNVDNIYTTRDFKSNGVAFNLLGSFALVLSNVVGYELSPRGSDLRDVFLTLSEGALVPGALTVAEGTIEKVYNNSKRVLVRRAVNREYKRVSTHRTVEDIISKNESLGKVASSLSKLLLFSALTFGATYGVARIVDGYSDRNTSQTTQQLQSGTEERKEKKRESNSDHLADVLKYSLLVGSAATIAGGLLYRNGKRRREQRLLEPQSESDLEKLSKNGGCPPATERVRYVQQVQDYLLDIRSRGSSDRGMVILPNIEVYYGSPANLEDNAAYIAPGRIVLNPKAQPLPVEILALRYATEVTKDLSLMRAIAADYTRKNLARGGK